MKTKNLLLISLIVLLFSCKNDRKTTNSKDTKQQIKMIKNTTHNNKKNVSKISILKDTIKSNTDINQKSIIKKNPKLRVVIKGKVYYKNNVNDKQKNSKNSYIYIDLIKYIHYDIRTGERVFVDGELGEPSN